MASVVSGAEPVPHLRAGSGRRWQAAMADAVTDPAELCRQADLPATLAAAAERASGAFSLLVPRPYLARIQTGDPRDPLLLQVLPQREELEHVPQFTADPVGEQRTGCCPGLLWKYPGRALMVTTAACGVHCRFCFRRHFPYHSLPKLPGDWEPTLERIAVEESIHEVILSGGDPLTLDDRHLAALARRLADMPHIKRLRVHTRMPIVIPQRVSEELLGWMRGTRLSPIVVVHVNHAREIDAPVATALARMADAGVPLLAQTVLLRGVNDRADALAELFERLVDHRVMPYYLHQLDRVSGAAHFEVPETVGIGLIRDLRARLPGYAVPRYVREVAGEPNKRLLC